MRINDYIDHTLLKPDATKEQIKRVCDEAITYGFSSVCVNPYYTEYAYERLKNSSVSLCVVVGFPLGATTKEVKALEAKQAVSKGADEIDMVINIGALKNKNYEQVQKDIQAVVEAVDEKTIVKVIIETCLLTDEEKIGACKIVQECGADFVKTSTGFSNKGATTEDVTLMDKAVGSKLGVKASGGIKSYEDAKKMIQAGARRIGASSSIAIVQESYKEKIDQ